ncbi:hypothetical protein SAMN02799624_03141 [Paenibacillus sp. UNC496MF]|uniref:hypothetical protein n=1 Tax=Paenibacillus sp. UNC496MF TaxID=1502753 RepID=UPI0008E42C62|nr:hypothetical protein [Paenibacillus sp. UNC496MF]SFJ04180.1 hypothetical protein SAMN02799624_03141 [Paenibacillus sp. UNC496MF]
MRVLAVICSIIMPGFGQLFNRQYVKALIFLLIELGLNSTIHLNRIIRLDMLGHDEKICQAASLEIAHFYPGFYVMNVWDAFASARAHPPDSRAIVFFQVAGLAGTLCVIFSELIPNPVVTSGFLMIGIILTGSFIFNKSSRPLSPVTGDGLRE